MAAIAVGQWENLVGRAKLALGRVPAGAAEVDLSTFEAPDSKFAREAELACAEQPEVLVGHCYRTWLFGNALATVDGIELDRELFYCGSLLHDIGIVHPTPDRDFTIAGADRALACASVADVAPDRATRLADAVCVHPTPGVRLEADGAVGVLPPMGGHGRRRGTAHLGHRAVQC